MTNATTKNKTSTRRTGWATTDEQERAIREERGREEGMNVGKLKFKQGFADVASDAFLALCRKELEP